MADDKMKNDDLKRNMGAKREDQDYEQQSPGHSGQGQGTRQHAGDQQSGGQSGVQQKSQMEDDDLDAGRRGGTQNRGGQNRN